jgi:hypothetical protein
VLCCKNIHSCNHINDVQKTGRAVISTAYAAASLVLTLPYKQLQSWSLPTHAECICNGLESKGEVGTLEPTRRTAPTWTLQLHTGWCSQVPQQQCIFWLHRKTSCQKCVTQCIARAQSCMRAEPDGIDRRWHPEH